jgi:hypothetical protein
MRATHGAVQGFAVPIGVQNGHTAKCVSGAGGIRTLVQTSDYFGTSVFAAKIKKTAQNSSGLSSHLTKFSLFKVFFHHLTISHHPPKQGKYFFGLCLNFFQG